MSKASSPSPELQAKAVAISATLAKALAPSDFIGPRLPAVSVGKTRYFGVWMPPVSAYIRANQRGERMTYPASYGRGLLMGDA